MYFVRKFKIPRFESEKHVFELGQKKSYQISGEACTELPGERELWKGVTEIPRISGNLAKLGERDGI